MTRLTMMAVMVLGLAGCNQTIDAGDHCLLASCEDPSTPTGPGGDGDGSKEGTDTTGSFQPFMPVTRGAKYVGDDGYLYDLSLMTTDAAGSIGCSLADPSANPGKAVSRVLFKLESNYGRALPCSPDAKAIGDTASGYFERWAADGTKLATVKAVGGATSFASSSAGANLWRCDVEITLTFPGGATFSDSFSYNYTGQGLDQSCIQGDACRCEAWQTCDAQKKCINLACVPAQGTCPADKSVACCAGTGSCTDGKCCKSWGAQCNPNANDCCYKCEYLNNSVYHGYYCTHP